MMITPRLITAIVLCSSFSISLTTFGAPQDDYSDGVSAFRAQQYDVALAHFTAAYEGGLQAPALHYNLGVTYFRLGRLPESYRAFSRIGDDAEWGPLAHYNMGLVAERQGRGLDAQHHFLIAYNRAESPRLRQLAAARLSDDTAGPGPR
jgi:tetratricopeptide (TPR) repeat protein